MDDNFDREVTMSEELRNKNVGNDIFQRDEDLDPDHTEDQSSEDPNLLQVSHPRTRYKQV